MPAPGHFFQGWRVQKTNLYHGDFTFQPQFFIEFEGPSGKFQKWTRCILEKFRVVLEIAREWPRKGLENLLCRVLRFAIPTSTREWPKICKFTIIYVFFLKIFAKIRKFPQKFANLRKRSQIFAKIRNFAKIFEFLRKFS